MNLNKSLKLEVPSEDMKYLFINSQKQGSDSTVYTGHTKDAIGTNINYAGKIHIQHEPTIGRDVHTRVDVRIGDTWLK